MKLMKDMNGAEIDALRQSIREAIQELIPEDANFITIYIMDEGDDVQVITNVHECDLLRFLKDQTFNCAVHQRKAELKKRLDNG